MIGCGEPEEVHWECTLPGGEAPPFAPQIGCEQDFLTLASEPTSSSIPGARSVKTSVDREAEFALSFQDSRAFPIHWDFLFNHRSAAQGLPRVPALAAFNASEYYLPDRRFLLGALTHYEGPDAWVYEISPYDTADASQILTAFDRIKANTYVGARLRFHPTSLNVEAAARELPRRVPLISTEELFSGSEYQALNVAESIGRLRFVVIVVTVFVTLMFVTMFMPLVVMMFVTSFARCAGELRLDVDAVGQQDGIAVFALLDLAFDDDCVQFANPEQFAGIGGD